MKRHAVTEAEKSMARSSEANAHPMSWQYLQMRRRHTALSSCFANHQEAIKRQKSKIVSRTIGGLNGPRRVERKIISQCESRPTYYHLQYCKMRKLNKMKRRENPLEMEPLKAYRRRA